MLLALLALFTAIQRFRALFTQKNAESVHAPRLGSKYLFKNNMLPRGENFRIILIFKNILFQIFQGTPFLNNIFSLIGIFFREHFPVTVDPAVEYNSEKLIQIHDKYVRLLYCWQSAFRIHNERAQVGHGVRNCLLTDYFCS